MVYGNRIQLLTSVSASIATYEFMTHLWEMDQPLPLEGPTTFSSSVFALPDTTEVINQLIWRQFLCVQHAIDESIIAALKPNYGDQVFSMLIGKNLEDKKQILQDAGIDYNSIPVMYRNGSAIYQTPSLVNTIAGQVTRSKWKIDFDIPIFMEARDFIKTIITTGSDIFRPKILEEKCINDKVIIRAEIFEAFEQQNKSGMEKYYFEKELSALIKTNQITGFEIKAGRNGGIKKQEDKENITITCSSGIYTGEVNIKAVIDFLNKTQLKRNSSLVKNAEKNMGVIYSKTA
jgi:hypothetical protein